MARILVGMSGGVDSAVSTSFLLQQGHEVIAGFMKNYVDESNPNCHTKQDRDMAIKVSQYLGIKTFVIFDFRKEYDEKIIQYIHTSYQAGLTPNPDVLCNSEIKFNLFLNEALKLGCDGIAMGHYAQIRQKTDNRGQKMYTLLKGVDTNKDQSYFLSRLNQFQLSKTHFPIGHLHKPEVRKIAGDLGLPNAERKDSQGLCFIGKVSIKDFLSQHLPKIPGPIYDSMGNYLGNHDGIQFYTIGQRHGFGGGGGVSQYIIHKDKVSNSLTVGPKESEDLYHSSLIAYDWHWIGRVCDLPKKVSCKVRYRQEDQEAVLSKGSNGSMLVSFLHPQRAISSGQFVVAYDGDECLGSGVIV